MPIVLNIYFLKDSVVQQLIYIRGAEVNRAIIIGDILFFEVKGVFRGISDSVPLHGVQRVKLQRKFPW